MIFSTLASLEQRNYGNWSVLILLIKAQACIPRVSNFNNRRVQICTKSAITNIPEVNQYVIVLTKSKTIRSWLIHLQISVKAIYSSININGDQRGKINYSQHKNVFLNLSFDQYRLLYLLTIYWINLNNIPIQ